MKDSIDEVIQRVAALNDTAKAWFFALLAFELTIVARSAYATAGDHVARLYWLRTINEHQHKLLGQVLAILSNETDRYPDHVILQGVAETTLNGDLDREVEGALRRAMVRLDDAS